MHHHENLSHPPSMMMWFCHQEEYDTARSDDLLVNYSHQQTQTWKHGDPGFFVQSLKNSKLILKEREREREIEIDREREREIEREFQQQKSCTKYQ